MYDCDEDLSREAATPSRAPDRRGWSGARRGSPSSAPCSPCRHRERSFFRATSSAASFSRPASVKLASKRSTSTTGPGLPLDSSRSSGGRVLQTRMEAGAVSRPAGRRVRRRRRVRPRSRFRGQGRPGRGHDRAMTAAVRPLARRAPRAARARGRPAARPARASSQLTDSHGPGDQAHTGDAPSNPSPGRGIWRPWPPGGTTPPAPPGPRPSGSGARPGRRGRRIRPRESGGSPAAPAGPSWTGILPPSSSLARGRPGVGAWSDVAALLKKAETPAKKEGKP